MTECHILTGEYLPETGGVAAYTHQVACGIAALGVDVHVWTPERPGAAPADPGVTIHRLPDCFGRRSSRLLTAAFDAPAGAPRTLLIQYVPQAFGWKGANVPFCRWVAARSRRDAVWVMFHEVLVMADETSPLTHRALARATRWMARLVAGRADRTFVSIPGWAPILETLRRDQLVTWTPVPSGVPLVDDPEAVRRIRARYAADTPLVGHFGTGGEPIRTLLFEAVRALSLQSDSRVLLVGNGSDTMRASFVAAEPSLEGRVFATGRLDAEDVSTHVSACDVMLQPYPDGVSSRRTSAMTALSHGRPLVTTLGWLTDPLWRDEQIAALAPVDHPGALADLVLELLEDEGRRRTMANRAAALYEARFALRHTVNLLTNGAAA